MALGKSLFQATYNGATYQLKPGQHVTACGQTYVYNGYTSVPKGPNLHSYTLEFSPLNQPGQKVAISASEFGRFKDGWLNGRLNVPATTSPAAAAKPVTPPAKPAAAAAKPVTPAAKPAAAAAEPTSPTPLAPTPIPGIGHL